MIVNKTEQTIITYNHITCMRYKIFALKISAIGKSKFLVYLPRASQSVLLTSTEFALLSSCEKFETLKKHALQYCRLSKRRKLANGKGILKKVIQATLKQTGDLDIEIPVKEQEMEPFVKKLKNFINNGFLVSDADVRNEIKTICRQTDKRKEKTSQINIIGIPTCNRSNSLRQSLIGLIDNCEKNSRNPDYLIIDDSTDTDIATQNRQVLQDLNAQYRVHLFYYDIEKRKKFVRKLSKESGCPEPVVNFALLGDNRIGITTGAARNTLMLLTTGKPWLHLDDDVFCQFLRQNNPEDGIELTAETPYQTFFPENGSVINHFSKIKEFDLLGGHETLLGKNPAEMLKRIPENKWNYDGVNAGLLRTFKNQDSHIGITFTGSSGDAGVHNTFHRLFLRGESFKQLVANSAGYSRNLINRQELRIPGRVTISNHAYCMLMCAALDNSRFLPPFAPVQRNSDGIFGALLKYCSSATLKGFLPVAVLHNPPEKRQLTTEDFFRRMRINRTNDILLSLIDFVTPPFSGKEPAENLAKLGQKLTGMAKLPGEDFQEIISISLINKVSRAIQLLEKRLQENPQAPDYWKNDITVSIETMQKAATQSSFYLPADLKGSDEERRELFRELVANFGRLLVCWPAMVETAKSISRDESFINDNCERV